ncbi:MAG: hypothetical protein JKP96_04365 [Oceanicaulis sp.]|nr:hypothetical protein [Oceanicaulis sp.]
MEYERFFSLSSELLARAFEGETSCHAELSNSKLLSDFEEVESNCNILRMLRSANRVTPAQLKGHIKRGKNTILVYPYEKQEGGFILYAQSFDTHKLAIKRYEEE